ncbi:unnamed protein product [Allacma fusca]|uniref:Uncharacterized protein n=1 Tax=Allacma fusca TaxID=39272 RepID=A0A8J2PCY0_9HEXA|nr:unnamed protein product [Allacma fusca]
MSYLTIFLAREGGNNAKECTERVLGRLITNELALRYNWVGKQFKERINKLPITKTSIPAIVKDAVHVVLPTANCLDIEETMKSWLRNAKSRIKILPQDG